MHSMDSSATSADAPAEPGLREQKRTATRRALIAATRSLSAEHGFSHVTVEEICERAGVSRRTFFNYFPAKEDAFLGRTGDDIPEELASLFVGMMRPKTGRARRELSPTLLDDLVDLLAGLARELPAERESFAEMKRAIDKDPRLLLILRDAGLRSADSMSALIARREGLEVDDPRVRMTTTLVGHLAHQAVMDFFGSGTTDTFHALLTRHVATAREIFAR